MYKWNFTVPFETLILPFYQGKAAVSGEGSATTYLSMFCCVINRSQPMGFYWVMICLEIKNVDLHATTTFKSKGERATSQRWDCSAEFAEGSLSVLKCLKSVSTQLPRVPKISLTEYNVLVHCSYTVTCSNCYYPFWIILQIIQDWWGLQLKNILIGAMISPKYHIASLYALRNTKSYSLYKIVHVSQLQYYDNKAKSREQGWHSGESTCLAPIWPRFDSQTRHHYMGWVCCWFSSGYSGFLLSTKTNIPKFQFQNSNFPLCGNHWNSY